MERQEGYVSIEELADYLDIKKRQAYHLVETLKIPHYRIGRLIKFKLSEVEEWMETNKHNPLEFPYEKLGS